LWLGSRSRSVPSGQDRTAASPATPHQDFTVAFRGTPHRHLTEASELPRPVDSLALPVLPATDLRVWPAATRGPTPAIPGFAHPIPGTGATGDHTHRFTEREFPMVFPDGWALIPMDTVIPRTATILRPQRTPLPTYPILSRLLSPTRRRLSSPGNPIQFSRIHPRPQAARMPSRSSSKTEDLPSRFTTTCSPGLRST
jgi:hypothetical protein